MTGQPDISLPRRRVALLTSGGDAPGMNAVVAGAAAQLRLAGGVAGGIRHGFAGLSAGRAEPIDPARAGDHVLRSGTWLRTSRWPEMRTPAGLAACCSVLAALDLEGLVVIGGNGSSAAARALAETLPVAFVPATIDRDIAHTDVAIGTDSAVRYALEVIDRLRVTADSLPGRGFLVETLGAPTGGLADAVAEAAGLEPALVPERPADLDGLAGRFRALAPHGRAIAVVSEAVGNTVALARELSARSGVRVHPSILGHAQRGAPPSPLDVAVGQAAGRAAIDAVLDGSSAFLSLGLHGDVTAHPLTAEPALLTDTSPTESAAE
jgi:6-phosphofructokinase 1